jgi:hypothetical protein
MSESLFGEVEAGPSVHIALGEAAASEAWCSLAAEIEARVPGVSIVAGKAPEGAGFSMEARFGTAVTTWRIFPDQAMRAALLEYLDAAVSGESGLEEGFVESLRSLARLAPLVSYTARWCEASASAASLMARATLAAPGLRVTLEDAEAIGRDDLPPLFDSVPLTLADGRARLYGAFTPKELLSLLSAASEGRHDAFCLAGLLGQKRGGEALALLREKVVPARAAGELVATPDVALRMGAILLLEDLARLDRALASEALPPVLAMLDDPSPRQRADALLAIAEIGDLRVLPRVEACLEDDDEDVREGAAETLERLRSAPAWG